jgi:CheY-like chemotaxis protein
MSQTDPATAAQLKPTVLLAEATADLRAVMAQSVRKVLPSAKIVEAMNGTETVAILRGEPCHLAIVDIALPVVSGVEAMTSARAAGQKPFLLLTSATVLPNWAKISTDVGAYEFLKKPFMPEDLESLLMNFAAMQQPVRTLVADASDQTRAMVRKVLSSTRFRMDVQETDNGGHALKLARMQPFDFALIDANLRGMSGLEAACQMQLTSPDTTVVCILPSNDGGLSNSLKHLGLQHSLRKPFFTRDIDMLLHTVRKLRRPYLLNAVHKAAMTALAG